MYIISLSETWHPFIRFLEKNNLSCFFLWIFFWVTKSKCFKFSIWQWQGAFSPKLPGTLGVGEWFADSLTQTWIMVCKSDLVNHLQFFFELLPPPPPPVLSLDTVTRRGNMGRYLLPCPGFRCSFSSLWSHPWRRSFWFSWGPLGTRTMGQIKRSSQW